MILHRVRPAADELFPMELDAGRFQAMLSHVASRFRVIGLEEGVRRLFEGTLPSRALALTFDDGYADNATVAAPLLRAAGLPATVFVAVGYLDGGMMWNDRIIEAVRSARGPTLDASCAGLGRIDVDTIDARRAAVARVLAAAKYLPASSREQVARELQAATGAADDPRLMMSSAQLAALPAAGLAVGAHTVSHPILAQLDVGRARAEIGDGKRRLEAIVGEPVTLFAYPNGVPYRDYGPEHVAMVRDAGFSAAVSTAHGAATGASDRFQLPRFTPWTREPLRFDVLMLRNLRARPELRVAA